MANRSNNRILTRDLLEYLGVVQVDNDGTIYTKQGVLKPRPYSNYGHSRVVFRDKTIRNEAKLSGTLTTNTGYLELSIHRVVYAWFNKVLPAELEVHHKDLDPSNNSIDNLVALTHEEHVREHRKMREQNRQDEIVEEKCRLDIPREHYVKKIEEYAKEGKYSAASQYRRRLKYYDNHIEEANQKIKDAKDLEILKYLKDTYRKEGHKAKWHMYNNLIKEWKTYSPEIKEEIMKCALNHV